MTDLIVHKTAGTIESNLHPSHVTVRGFYDPQQTCSVVGAKVQEKNNIVQLPTLLDTKLNTGLQPDIISLNQTKVIMFAVSKSSSLLAARAAFRRRYVPLIY